MWKSMSSLINNDSTVYENGSPYVNNNVLENEKQPNNSNHQLQQLFQEMVNVLNRTQESQTNLEEQTFVKILTYAGGNQDPVEWLESVNSAFEANKIVGT